MPLLTLPQRLENQPFTDPHAFCTPSRALLMVFLMPSQAFPAPALILPHKFENQPVTVLHTFLIASHAALNIPTIASHNFLNHAATSSQYLTNNTTAAIIAMIPATIHTTGHPYKDVLNTHWPAAAIFDQTENNAYCIRNNNMPFLYSLTILVPIFMESDTIRNTLPNCPTMNVTLPIAMAAVPNIAIHLPVVIAILPIVAASSGFSCTHFVILSITFDIFSVAADNAGISAAPNCNLTPLICSPIFSSWSLNASPLAIISLLNASPKRSASA